MLSNPQFELARKLALNLAGIELLPRHQEALGRKALRLGISDTTGWDLLLAEVEAGKLEAQHKLLKLILTNFTGFFRHPDHFEVAATHLLRTARTSGSSRCWCAGVATGEEPYSLAMTLLEKSGDQPPHVTLLATELEPGAMELAKRGEYDEKNLRDVPPTKRERFLQGSSLSGLTQLAPAVRNFVEFRILNLVNPVWPIEGPWDVIFCRNVIMYLAEEYRRSVLERMAAMLSPDGLLILDPSEHLGKVEELFTSGARGVFALRSAWPQNTTKSKASLSGTPTKL